MDESSKEGKRFRLRLEDVAVAFQSENEGCKRSLNHSNHNKKINSHTLISLTQIASYRSLTQLTRMMAHSLTRPRHTFRSKNDSLQSQR